MAALADTGRAKHGKFRPGVAAEIAQAVALGLTVFALAWLSIDLTRQSGRVATIWPVNGVALVCLLRTDARRWPGLLFAGFLGVLSADLAWGNPAATALALTLCDGMEIAMCAAALRRFAGPQLDLQRQAHLWLFAGLCGLAAPVIAASATVSVIVANAHANPLRAWTAWALADALGMLVLVPPLLLLSSTAMERAVSSRRVTNILGFVLLAAVVTGVFVQSRPLLFLIAPALVLVTFQMEIAGAALGVLLTAAIAVSWLPWATGRRRSSGAILPRRWWRCRFSCWSARSPACRSGRPWRRGGKSRRGWPRARRATGCWPTA